MIERIRREIFEKIETEKQSIEDIRLMSKRNGIEIDHTDYESKIKELSELQMLADGPMDLKKSNEMNKSLRKILTELAGIKNDLRGMVENNKIGNAIKEHFPGLNKTAKDTVESLEVKKAVISKLREERAQKRLELQGDTQPAKAPLHGGKEVTKAQLQEQLKRVHGSSKLVIDESIEQDKSPKKQ
jgi:hypothetical protein